MRESEKGRRRLPKKTRNTPTASIMEEMLPSKKEGGNTLQLNHSSDLVFHGSSTSSSNILKIIYYLN